MIRDFKLPTKATIRSRRYALSSRGACTMADITLRVMICDCTLSTIGFDMCDVKNPSRGA
jgi:hypothetical protein